MANHPELEVEQAHIDHAYECLERARAKAASMREGVEDEAGGTFQNRYERDVVWERVGVRLHQLELGERSLVFGRVDTEPTETEPEGETFHITGGVGVSPRVFFGRYAAMLGVPLRSVPYPIAVAAAPLVAALFRAAGRPAPLSGRTLEYVTHPGTYSISKAARLLGWHPTVALDEGMRRTEAWLREEGLVGG